MKYQLPAEYALVAKQASSAIADAQLDILRRWWESSPKGKAAGVGFEDWAGEQIKRVDYFR